MPSLKWDSAPRDTVGGSLGSRLRDIYPKFLCLLCSWEWGRMGESARACARPVARAPPHFAHKAKAKLSRSAHAYAAVVAVVSSCSRSSPFARSCNCHDTIRTNSSAVGFCQRSHSASQCSILSTTGRLRAIHSENHFA